jgi:hypothetical protein
MHARRLKVKKVQRRKLKCTDSWNGGGTLMALSCCPNRDSELENEQLSFTNSQESTTDTLYKSEQYIKSFLYYRKIEKLDYT